MPFLALHDGTEVIPNQVQKGNLLECPKCGDQLKIRDSHRRKGSFVARHFYHAAEEETDCGGESPPHLRMKSIAYSKLTTEYPDATIGLEQQLGDRRADILVEFPQPRFPEGRGIGVEVQHKHEDKDVDAVTAEYLAAEYSVLWLGEEDFSGFNVDLSGILSTWPHAVQHDFSDGYHGAIHWLRQPKPANPSIDVVLPREYLAEHSEGLRRAWEYGKFDQGGQSDWKDLGFWWLSASYDPYQKWFKLTETPDGRTMLQLGKQVRGTEHVLAPVQTGHSRNRGKVHSLAYEVDSADTSAGEWADIEKAWLETGLQSTSVIFKLVATPSGELALSLGKYKEHSDDGEFITVSTEFQRNLKESLHELANLLG